MLEILIVISISRKIAAMMKEKGRSAGGYIAIFVVLWFGGEILGAIAGVVISMMSGRHPQDGGFDFFAYIFALVGAAIGGTLGYVIAKSVGPVEDPRKEKLERFDEEEEYVEEDRPRRRRRASGDGSFEDATERG